MNENLMQFPEEEKPKPVVKPRISQQPIPKHVLNEIKAYLDKKAKEYNTSYIFLEQQFVEVEGKPEPISTFALISNIEDPKQGLMDFYLILNEQERKQQRKHNPETDPAYQMAPGPGEIQTPKLILP